MNEDLKKSLFLNSPLLILGPGLIAPLYACGTIQTNIITGLLAVVLLIISNCLIATLRLRTPKNGRIGLAIIMIGGLLAVVKATLSTISPMESLPVESLAPLLVACSVLTVSTDAYDVKKRLTPALFDAVAIGISFLLRLCITGLIRDLLGGNLMHESGLLKKIQPVRLMPLVTGTLLLGAAVAALWPGKRRGAS